MRRKNSLPAAAVILILAAAAVALATHQVFSSPEQSLAVAKTPNDSTTQAAICARNEEVTFRINVLGLQPKCWSVLEEEGSIKVKGESITLRFAQPNNPPTHPDNLCTIRYNDRKGKTIGIVFRGVSAAELKTARNTTYVLGDEPSKEIHLYGGSHMYVWGTERGVKLPTSSTGFGNKAVAYIPR